MPPATRSPRTLAPRHGAAWERLAPAAAIDLKSARQRFVAGAPNPGPLLKNHVARDLEGENSMFVANVAGAVGAIAGALRDDEALQRKLHRWLLRGVERLMLDHFEIGKDLQFIQINGTVVGGIVGVVLRAVTTLLA